MRQGGRSPTSGPSGRLNWSEDTTVQWLFPLREASRFNPLAPVLAQQDEEAFRANPALRARLLRSLDLMLAFYGLSRVGESIEPVSGVNLAQARWLSPGDHNHLRLSRIVQSLALLGEEQWARALRACLLDIARDHPSGVSRETVEHWSRLLEQGGC